MAEVGSYYQEADAPHWVCRTCGQDVLQVIVSIRCGARPGRDSQWRHADTRGQRGIGLHVIDPVPAAEAPRPCVPPGSGLVVSYRDRDECHGVWTCRACEGFGLIAGGSCVCCQGMGVHWPGERCET